MGSLIFIVLWIAALVAALSWAMARAARAVGSTRGQFRWGLVAVLTLSAVAWGFLAITPSTSPPAESPPTAARFHDGAVHLEPQQRDPALFWIIVLLVAQLALSFFIPKYVFRLTALRTLAPIGANLGMTALAVGVLVVAVNPWMFEAFVIPTRSMAPTIEDRGRIAVNKFLAPRRWDLAVYKAEFDESPVNHRNEQRLNFCKRLIGLPGERLRFEDGNLFVDDKRLTPPTVLAGRLHSTVPDVPATEFRYADGDEIQLADDEYFFIGDNVERSKDSRIMGPSHASALIGVVDLIYWPPSHARIVR